MIKFVTGLVMRIWLRLAFSFRRAPKPLQTVYLEELPEQLDANSVYVLGEGPHKWFVALLCPCGCSATMQMSLLRDAIPKWQLFIHADKSISLQPSIWRKVGCRSHFFLRRGFIEWCQPRRPNSVYQRESRSHDKRCRDNALVEWRSTSE